MIIDADTHISLTEPDGQTAETLLRLMDAGDIDRAIIWLQPPYYRDIVQANRYVYESWKKYPDRFIPFGWADPNMGVDASIDVIKRCLEEYAMKGIKLNGAQNSYYIDDLQLVEPLIREIDRQKSVLALHIGADFYEFTHPFRAAKIADRHPALRMLLLHMGGAGRPDLGDACIEFTQQHDNMMLVGSAISYPKVLKAIQTLGAHRVCFGSDTPFSIPKVEAAAYNALLEDVLSSQEQALVMGGNIAAFLNI